ncbi:uncharacterized protein LOC131674274 isoform X2 [Phymastichus coffea]|uniref:uncharacterized protein LOC131674274 isoform X2 n=1 Tax=Phymastichus coffea TaxID=108790 RepID=UPI00273AC884|nr:uncharacterized protein LOC131674274 isoform X2 [Phymastichus coffea]
MCECCGFRAMKTWNSIKVACLECLTPLCVKYELSKMPKRTIILLVAGLDGAGKSTVVNYLFNKSYLPKSTVVPTIGFRTVTFKYKRRLTIRLYDVGGSPQIRELWKKYYEEVHGVIYVVDSSDNKRLFETAQVFQELACHDFITQKPILILANKQDQRITLNEMNLIDFMNLYRVANFSRCFTRVEICTCFRDRNKNFNLNKSIDKGFEWLINMIDYNYEDYEREMEQRREKRKALRQGSARSWAAQKIPNPFDYPDTDSDTYGKPIIPNDELLDKQTRKKRKSLMNLFCRSRNKTAPLPEENNVPTKQEMKELIRSITIEDLIRNTQVQEDAIVQYRRPKRWRKKRPTTAPSKIELPSEVQVHASQEGKIEKTVVQLNQQGKSSDVTTVQINNRNDAEEVIVEANVETSGSEARVEVIEEIV